MNTTKKSRPGFYPESGQNFYPKTLRKDTDNILNYQISITGILRSRPESIYTLSRLTGLSRSDTTRILFDLCHKGIVRFIGGYPDPFTGCIVSHYSASSRLFNNSFNMYDHE